MDFIEAMQIYFRGERTLGFALVAVGLACAGYAFWAWRAQQGDFAAALSIALLVIGLAFAAGGAGLAIKTDAQVAELTRLYREDPAAFVKAEKPRMERVNANWPLAKMAWAVIAALAMASLLFVKKDWVHGVALGLLVATTVLFFVDVLGERRALLYVDHINALPAAQPHDAP